uniref:NADH dehydrogenase subunit 4L n=1 Tax=Naesiotus nux TaxID=1755238 RepID=A0A0S2IAM9_NAENU|nr:NADH dehydrogenase subunit 4L [Naesiotus nux]ALO20560.1 NADH dehydrogenase subunit 4L [Naesiotus nux]
MSIIFMIYVFFISCNHVLSSLIILEFITLLMLVGYILLSSGFLMEIPMFIILLSFSVCEAALGLTVLLSFIKLKGNDMLMSNK